MIESACVSICVLPVGSGSHSVMLAAFAPDLPLTPLIDKIRNFVMVALEYILIGATVGFPLFFFQIFLSIFAYFPP